MRQHDHFFIIRQFASFTAVGVAGTVAHYCVLIALIYVLQLHPVPASAAGFAVGALVNYGLNYRLTFRSTKMHRESMPKFFIVAIAGLMLNTAIMAVMTTTLRLHYLVAQVFATGCVLIWNFTVNRRWTFR